MLNFPIIHCSFGQVQQDYFSNTSGKSGEEDLYPESPEKSMSVTVKIPQYFKYRQPAQHRKIPELRRLTDATYQTNNTVSDLMIITHGDTKCITRHSLKY